jgi:hypothetical protein
VTRKELLLEKVALVAILAWAMLGGACGDDARRQAEVAAAAETAYAKGKAEAEQAAARATQPTVQQDVEVRDEDVVPGQAAAEPRVAAAKSARSNVNSKDEDQATAVTGEEAEAAATGALANILAEAAVSGDAAKILADAKTAQAPSSASPTSAAAPEAKPPSSDPSAPVATRSGDVKLGATTVEGPGEFDAALVVAKIRQRLGGIRACYERRLRENPTLAGQVVVEFSIGERGNVENVQQASAFDDGVGTCVVNEIRRLPIFPVGPVGGAVRFSYPLDFGPVS